MYRLFLFFLLVTSNAFADKLEISFHEPNNINQQFDAKISLIDNGGTFSTQSYSLSSSQIDNNSLSFDVDFTRLSDFVLVVEKSNDKLAIKTIKDIVSNQFRKKAESSKYLKKHLKTSAMKQPEELIAVFGTDSLLKNVIDIPDSINNEYYKNLPVPKNNPLYTEYREEFYTNHPIAVNDFTQALNGETLEKRVNFKLVFELDTAKEMARRWHDKQGTYFDENLDDSYIITTKSKLLTKRSIVKIEVRIDQDGKFVSPEYQGKIIIRQIYIQTDDNIVARIGSPDYLQLHT